MRPSWVVCRPRGQLCPFLGLHVKKHEMLCISKSDDVLVIWRKSWKPHAFGTAHGRELMAFEIQMIDGACWQVSEEQRVAIQRPVRHNFVALAVGHFFKRSTLCRHDIDVRWLTGHVGTEYNLLPVGRPLSPRDVHGGRSELKP